MELRTFTVTVLEQLPSSLVALSWRDPTLCNYEEQMWSPGFSRTFGRCTLCQGDAIYETVIRGRTVPLNPDAMILPSTLARIATRLEAGNGWRRGNCSGASVSNR